MVIRIRKPVPKFIHDQVLLEQEGRCKDCREKQEWWEPLQEHHKDGDPSNSRDPKNLELLCKECHDEKHRPWNIFVINGIKQKRIPKMITDILDHNPLTELTDNKDRIRIKVVERRDSIDMEILTNLKFWATPHGDIRKIERRWHCKFQYIKTYKPNRIQKFKSLGRPLDDDILINLLFYK